TAAEMGRPMTILDHDYDTELPSAYEIEEDNSAASDDAQTSSPASPPPNVPVYTSFIQLIKLSEILGQVLQGLYSPRARSTGLGLANADSLANILDRSLTNWKVALPEELQYQPGRSNKLVMTTVIANIKRYFHPFSRYCNVGIMLLYRADVTTSPFRINDREGPAIKLSSTEHLHKRGQHYYQCHGGNGFT
ncbi:hypothetical protein BC936DRAFT_149143, partial [Jimgerdemannia flammicorona]